jgi:hypothetical protein
VRNLAAALNGLSETVNQANRRLRQRLALDQGEADEDVQALPGPAPALGDGNGEAEPASRHGGRRKAAD